MKYLLSFLSPFLLLGHLFAQTPQHAKDLQTITSGVFLNSASAKKVQEWYNPGDFNTLPGSGSITKVYFKSETANATGTYTNFILSMKQPATGTGFTGTTFETGMATVLTSPSLVINGASTANGWFALTLTTPFVYDNTKPLVFEIQYSAYSGGINTWASDAGSGVTKKLYTGTLTATTGTAHNAYWQDFGIDVLLPPCVAPPTPGTAVASVPNVCSGGPVQLSLSGNSVGTGQTYVWQSSTTLAGTYTDISTAAPSAVYTTNPSATLYYRAAVTCGVSTGTSVPVQVTVPALFPGGTYTINSGAATGGTNFASFGDAVNAIKCGISGPVVFNVVASSGPYNEQVIIPHINTTSATNTVTFNGNGNTLTFNSSNTDERGVLKLDGADYITVNNLNIVAPGTTTTNYGFGVHMLNNADNNTINNCTINVGAQNTSTNYAGIVASGSGSSATSTGSDCDNLVISNNTIIGGYYGIVLMGNGLTTLLQNNQVTNNTITDPYFYGIYINGNNNALIEKNDVSRPTKTSVSTFYGVALLSGNTNVKVSKNKIHNPLDAASTSTSTCYGLFSSADATTGNPNVFSNNLVYNFNGGTGTQYGLGNTGADYNVFYHNTVVLDDAAANCACEARGFYQTTAATGIELKNNIFYVTRGGSVDRYGLYFNTTGTTFTADNNLYYIASGGTGTNYVGYKSSGSQTLAAWQTAVSQDANSIVANPLFTSATNFTPTNNIDNLGTPVGITTDINNAARSLTTPDLGAIEFTVSGCTTPPTAGTSTASAVLVCSGAPVQLGLTGNTTGAGQTYKWQTSTTLAGTYTDINTPASVPAYAIAPVATLFYRAAVTCGASTTYSAPVQVTVNNGLTGTYTINAGAPATATNFQSFGDAVNAMSCGVIGPVVFNVVAASGPYNEQVIIPAITGSSATNTVTFNGNGNTLTYASSVSAQRATLKLDGADYVTINNLNIAATGTTYGYVVQMLNDADFNKIDGCTLTTSLTTTSTTSHSNVVISGSATSPSTAGSNCDNIIISNNNIIGGYHSISMMGSTTVTPMNNCQVINNSITDFYGTGIQADGHNNLVVTGNDFSRPTRTASASTITVIDFAGDVVKSLVSKNRIHNLAGGHAAATSTCYPISHTASDGTAGNENVVTNNLIYDINTASGTVYAFYNSGSDYVLYYHNTVVLDNTAATSGATRGLYQTTSATGIEFKNNIVYITRGGTTAKYGIYRNAPASTITANNNVYYINSAGSPTANYIGYIAGNQATLAGWQTASSQDANSYAIDPLFMAPASANFRPTELSIDNQGAPLGIATDILNIPRILATPDIGAYEFGTPLSVKLLDFTAAAANSDVQVSWRTSADGPAKYFIERSADGKAFEEVGKVTGSDLAKTTNAYSFTDMNAKEVAVNQVLYYRLRTEEASGAIGYSNTAVVKFSDKTQGNVNIYPNPFTDKLIVDVDGKNDATVSAFIRDVVGRVVYSQKTQLTGRQLILDGLNDLPSGFYELSLVIDNTSYTYKIIK